jgi:hypothetical protein
MAVDHLVKNRECAHISILEEIDIEKQMFIQG